MGWFEHTVTTRPVWQIGLILFVVMCAVALVSNALRERFGDDDAVKDGDGPENYIFSAVAGLLALLMGFTFSMAVDRFDSRRVLVLEEANAIGAAYLRSQLLVEPHRSRMSDLIVAYTDNRLVLGKAQTVDEAFAPRQRNDALIVDIWTGTVAAWDSIKGYDFSSAYLDSIKTVIDLDASRKTARNARVPNAVLGVLFVYVVASAAVLGYVIRGRRNRLTAALLMALFTLSLMLIVDINRPVGGRVVETQRPMEELQKFLHGHPRAIYDRWTTPTAPAAPPAKR